MKRKMLLALSAALVAGSSLAAAPALQADPTKAKAIVEQVCAACHGVDGNSVAAINPTLAGQSQQYLHAQLKAFKAGTRQNPTMLGMASTLSDQDMVNVAAYFSQQKVKPRDASDKTQLELGKTIYRTGNAATKLPACMACHGPAGAGLPEKYPRMGGQHASYIVKQLQDYKGATVRNNVIMTDIAARMSDAEMKAVAEYISGLR
jgi:cytochrome c553